MTDTDNRSDPFDSADFYDCRDEESYHHLSPQECIADMLEAEGVPDAPVSDIMDMVGDIVVCARKRVPIPDEYFEAWAESMVSRLEDDYDESEFANPEETLRDDLGEEKWKQLVAAVAKTIKDELGKHASYHCEKVAERTYTRAEVEVMMRVYAPDWFEVKP